jgi:hypothetical protein
MGQSDKPQNAENYCEKETARRREAALKRMTPHKPHKHTKDSGKSPAKRGMPKKQDK